MFYNKPKSSTNLGIPKNKKGTIKRNSKKILSYSYVSKGGRGCGQTAHHAHVSQGRCPADRQGCAVMPRSSTLGLGGKTQGNLLFL